MATRAPQNLRIAELEASVKGKAELCVTVRHGITVLGVVAAVYIVAGALQAIVAAQPAAIEQLSKVVSALSLSQVTCYLVGGAGATWAVKERRGRKHAIERAGRLEKKLESQDAYNARSGLDESGNTPRENEDV
jgi:hypothetical protein